MSDLVVDWVEIGIECMLSTVIIVYLLTIIAASQSVNSKVSEQQMAREIIREYRAYNQYDNTTVYSQDVVSAIYSGRGMPEVTVVSSKGVVRWSESTTEDAFTATYISSQIDMDNTYDATIERSLNGEVIGLEFRAAH